MALVQVRDYFLIPESVPLVKCLLDAGSSAAAAPGELAASGDTSGDVTGCTSAL